MVVAQRILELAKLLGEGMPLTAKELLHLGSRAAVDQALSRLARRGELLRVGRGLYVLPVAGKFGARAPEASKVARALGEKRHEVVVPSGAAAANELGLTTQVPVRLVYLTSGRTKKLQAGAQTVELQHAPAWQLVMPGERAGNLVRALAWAGPENAAAIVKQWGQLLGREERERLLKVRAMVPSWLAAAVSLLAHHG